jgi:GntR family transcriptional regulator
VQRVVDSFVIDRVQPIPLYFQVSQHFERAIESGAFAQGSLLPNEIELAEQLKVSRPTMRKAMELLVGKGLIVRRRGIGTRVVQPKVRRPLELTSLYDDLTAAGQKPSTEVLAFDTIEADAHVAGKLGITAGAPVVHVERLRSTDDRPIARMTNFLRFEAVRFDGSDLESAGLYDLLGRSGVLLHSATQTVSARPATTAEARLLGESRGAALLTMERETLDQDGVAVEYATHLYAASRYSFEIHLIRS